MNFLKYGFLVFATMMLMGCSHFANRDNSYLNAKSIPPTRIPPGLTTNEFHNYYPVPDTTSSEVAKKPSIVPPGLMSN